MADAAIAIRPESPIQPTETVAGPIHTLFLLVILSAVAILGYFFSHRPGAEQAPHRVFFYLGTMAWEWLLVGYIYRGLRRRGKSIRNIAGES